MLLIIKHFKTFPNLLSKSSIANAAILTAVVIFFNGQLVFAENVPLSPLDRAIEQDIEAKQRIESERRDLIRSKEAEEINNIGKAKTKAAPQNALDQVISDQTCRFIQSFELSGNNVISTKTLNRKFINPLKESKPDSCFTKADLITLHHQIENYYLNQGYVLARVYFDPTDLAKGVIRIVIEEGKLEKLELKDNSKLNDRLPYRRTLQKLFAFPSLNNDSDKVINLRDIEQGLEQINRLGSQNAKMNIEPGNKAGYSNININNQIGHLATLNFTADNSGNQSTGKMKRKASLNYDNLLGINDNIYLNYSQSNGMPLFGLGQDFNQLIGTNDNSKNRFAKSFYGAISIPFGYWTIGGSYSYSSYLLTSKGEFTNMRFSGNSENKSYYLERVLLRGKNYKSSLKAELSKNDTDSYLEDTYLPVNSRRTTEANLYFNNTFYFNNGNLHLQPKYSKGLRALGAMKDSPNLTASQPKAQFETFGLYAQSNFNFTLNWPPMFPLFRGSELLRSEAKQSYGGAFKLPLNHKLTFDSVISNDSLYGASQFSLGGRYTLRGFQESVISGDSGYVIKNDLSARVFDLIPENFLKANWLNSLPEKLAINSTLSKTRFGIFHDYGYVRNHIMNHANDEGYMSGAGAMLSYFGNNFNWDVTYSRGLHSPQFLRNIDNTPKDNETIYFSLGINLGLL